MNIVFNKCIFVYLCHFYILLKYFREFQSIFVDFRFTDISVKSKYRYVCVYRYFDPCFLLCPQLSMSHVSLGNILVLY